jgi:peptidoglycan hydrolase-like protein with peptidoglycan-binding domain
MARVNISKFRCSLAILAAGVSLLPGQLSARAKRPTAPALSRRGQRTPAAHESTRTTSHQRTSLSPTRSRHTHRKVKARRQPSWTKVRLGSGRVEEIQRALGQAGYYQGEPTGRWDDRTRDAMRRYQTANGFGATGLPDAKSIMKLGLGPHPLPEDVAPPAATTAQITSPEKADSPDQAPQQ